MEIIKKIQNLIDGKHYSEALGGEAIRLARDNNIMILRPYSDDIVHFYGVRNDLTNCEYDVSDICNRNLGYNFKNDDSKYLFDLSCSDEFKSSQYTIFEDNSKEIYAKSLIIQVGESHQKKVDDNTTNLVELLSNLEDYNVYLDEYLDISRNELLEAIENLKGKIK